MKRWRDKAEFKTRVLEWAAKLDVRARSLAVCTFRPGATARQQLGASTRSPAISTTQARQLPSGRRPSL